MKINTEFRIWFFTRGEKLLGKGRVELLERIHRTGSILNAAREMKMSYRQAWQMVNEMNERASQPFVIKKMGGRSGGGARVTHEGKEAIKSFHTIEKKVHRFLREQTATLKF